MGGCCSTAMPAAHFSRFGRLLKNSAFSPTGRCRQGTGAQSRRTPRLLNRPSQSQTRPRFRWNECQPIEPGTIATTYWERRGCALPHPDGDLRWHPALWHGEEQVRGPALVALVTDATTGEARTVHRTWLAADGRGKAAFERPRLIWADSGKRGGVVRLWPDSEVTTGLCVAEGIETALVAARGFGPVWALVDAGNLKTLPVLSGIEALTIVADNDEAGIRGAEACSERWCEAGVQVRLWRSSVAREDLNDWARR
jgi:putative DNA primase/helicase